VREGGDVALVLSLYIFVYWVWGYVRKAESKGRGPGMFPYCVVVAELA
jgi:hypothetical protein